MKKLKHSKFRNTGILFELLVRQLTEDTLNKKDSKSLPIIKKYFGRTTELSKELQLYQSLIKEKFTKDERANHLIDAILTARKSLNNSILSRQKYNLIKEIKESYVIEDFFKASISDYKTLASIYNLFEYKVVDSPTELTKCRHTLIEHITQKSTNSKQINEMQEFVALDKDVRLLSYKILVDKFNEKYSGLNIKQKNLLREYINNISNTTTLKDYISQEIPNIKLSIASYLSKVTSPVVKIKLHEVSNLLESISSSKTIKDRHILSLLRFYELLKELKKIQ